MMNIMEAEELHGPQTYQKFPVVIVRGSGAEVWDDQNNPYVDCMGGYGVAIVGHCNPEVVAAVKSQAERLITCHSSLYNDLPGEAHFVHAEGARRRVPLEQRGGGQRGRDKTRQEVHG
jgi:acetylornithine/succinyldiaminopimelate/putrescine aminotransferase